MFYKKEQIGIDRCYSIFGYCLLKIRRADEFREIYFCSILIFKKSRSTLLRNLLSEIKDAKYQLSNIKSELQDMKNLGYDLKLKLNNINSITKAHSTSFSGYKNKFKDKDVVIVCTGPTYSNYIPIPNAIHIGVNRAFKRKDVCLDFLFVQDVSGLTNEINSINEYRKDHCIKFFGYTLSYSESGALPQSEDDLLLSSANRYYTGGFGTEFNLDISCSVLADYGSVVFSALSFALYTHPSRIFLVGCDASKGNFEDDFAEQDFSNPHILHGWKSFKRFKDNFYPYTNIISVNPVGLKGLFEDMYL